MIRKHSSNRMQKKPNDFGLKYGNQKKKKNNEKVEWINNLTIGLEELEEGPETEIHRFTQNDTKIYQTGKRQAMMEYMVSSSRISPSFTTD